MDLSKLSQQVFDEIFRDFSKTAFVFPKGSKSKQSNFDPNRNTGYVKAFQNALPVKYISKAVTANSLIWKEIGLTQTGAIQIIVSCGDADIIKISKKVEIEDVDYYAFSNAVDNKVQIFPTQFSGFSKIILFRKNT